MDSSTTNIGYQPRPADQRVMFNMFFTDYIPKFPYIRLNLNLIFGSGLLIIAGQVLLTYIGYKDHLRFEEFVDFVWQKTLIAYGILFIISFIASAKEKKEINKK